MPKFFVKIILSGKRSVPVFAGLLLLFSSTAFAQTLPVAPTPTGSYSVGTQEFSLIDNSRPETLTDDANDKRELYIRVWYPAQNVPADAKPQPIFGKQTKEIAEALTTSLRLPKGALNFLALVPSHSYPEAPIAAKGKFPVITFSHGYYQGFAAQNAVQMEELASHGYVVFGIGHTYETILNVFPDGRAVPAGKAMLYEPNSKVNELTKAYTESKSAAEKAAYANQIVLLSPAIERLHIWAADIGFVIDEIERMNAGKAKSIFANKLDIKRIGVMGMSFGGAAAGQVCLKDKRCRAGINMDGRQHGDLYANGLKRPFMFMNNETQDTGINRDIYQAARSDAYFLTVKGAKHLNFSNFNLFSALDRGNQILGKIPGDRMEKIMSTYTLVFFDKYLKNIDSPMLERSSPDLAEVVFSAKR
ncbi:MAG: isoform II [Acidobacteria bacterium]|nr:isoform II [Acidobacteriota bacterium]